MAIGIGIDVYGTLVDPLEMNAHLRPLVGAAAGKLAELWRTKQLEYTFRRAAMGKYENFDVCSRQALIFAFERFQIDLSAADRERLLKQYQSLQPYPDVVPGLQKLKDAGYQAVAFSNGVEATLRELFRRAEILPHLQGIVSVDDLRTFKPAPQVYLYLARRLRCTNDNTWVASSNPFDYYRRKIGRSKGCVDKAKVRSCIRPLEHSSRSGGARSERLC